MSGAAFLRIKKLKGAGIVLVAARHNKRETLAESDGPIDAGRTRQNESLHGPVTAGSVAHLAKDLMKAAGVPTNRRKDAVMGLELVFSLPPNHQLDDKAYFSDCLTWTAANFGGIANVLSVDIHRDEAAPHCHVLALPLIGNRMAGSDLMGGPAQLGKTLNDFHSVVATKHGLKKAPKRLQGEVKRAAADAVLDRLKRSADPVLKSLLWPTVRDQIERDPSPWLQSLGIEVQQAKVKPVRTFTQIMTSKGAGPTRERTLKGFEQSLKGFQHDKTPNPLRDAPVQKERTLSCEGFAFPKPPIPSNSFAHLGVYKRLTAGAIGLFTGLIKASPEFSGHVHAQELSRVRLKPPAHHQPEFTTWVDRDDCESGAEDHEEVFAWAD